MSERVAVVTGAAGAVGTEIARVLGCRGITVAVVDKHSSKLYEKAEKMAADGLRVEPFIADVSDPTDVEAVVSAVERRLGPVEFLVNSAAERKLGPVRELGYPDWLAVFQTNVTGVFLMSQAVVRRMIPRKRGAVVTVTAGAGTTPQADLAAFGAAMAAAAMFTRSLGLEVARHGIRCNVVAPGPVDTVWRSAATAPKSVLDGRPDAFRVGIPLGRTASPVDVAEAVDFLLSGKAAHITLQSLTVDGGAGLGV